MKKLFLLFLTPFLFAQDLDLLSPLLKYQAPRATVLNGTNQRWSKSSPSNLDLNGSEMITAADDRGFESTVGNWVDGGTHSITRSTTDKRTGSASGRIVSTAAGDTTTNFVSLPNGNFGTITSGNKYTVEGWARGTGILGSNIVTNGTFDVSTTGWSALSGATLSVDANRLKIENTTSYPKAEQTLTTVSGTVYKVTFTYTNGTSSGGGSVRAGTSSTGVQLLNQPTSEGANTFYFTATTTTTYFDVLLTTTTAGQTGFFDDIVVSPVTLPSITAVIGSKTATTASVSCVPGTFTKFVLNFQATSSEVGDTLKLYVNQADTVYVDDISIKPAYDLIFGGAVQTSATGVQIICNASLSGSSRLRMFLNNSTPTVTFTDGTTSVSATNSATVNNGYPHTMFATLSRTGNLTLYVDGVAGSGASVTAIGSMTADSLTVGSGSSGQFFNGKIFSRQRIRFSALPSDDGASIVVDAHQRFKRKQPFAKIYPSGTVVAWYDWRSGGLDLSGSGNHLTPTNNPIIVNVQY